MRRVMLHISPLDWSLTPHAVGGKGFTWTGWFLCFTLYVFAKDVR